MTQDRQLEQLVMAHICPPCKARGGEVCDPYPYPSFEAGRRMHEIRYEGPIDRPGLRWHPTVDHRA